MFNATKDFSMDKKLVAEWKYEISKILYASRKFMQSCNKNFGRGFIGELLVLNQLIKTFEKELCQEGNEIKYSGSSRKKFDFELILGSKVIEINSKGTLVLDKKTKKPLWVRQHAGNFCRIGEKSGATTISLIKEYRKNYFYIYVDVNAWLIKGKTDFYVLSDKEAKMIFGKIYKRDHHGEKPHRESDDMWIKYEDVFKRKDKNLSQFKKTVKNIKL